MDVNQAISLVRSQPTLGGTIEWNASDNGDGTIFAEATRRSDGRQLAVVENYPVGRFSEAYVEAELAEVAGTVEFYLAFGAYTELGE